MVRLTSYKSNGKRDLQSVLDKLAEYEDLEEQGRLLRLPCLIGSMVYRVDNLKHRINSYIVKGFYTSGKTWWCTTENFSFAFDKIGKTVFLTMEDAEIELKSWNQYCDKRGIKYEQ